MRTKGTRTNGGGRHASVRSTSARTERTSRAAGPRTGRSTRSSRPARKATSARSGGQAHRARGSGARGRHAIQRRQARPAPYAVKLLKQDHRALLDCMEQLEDAMQAQKHSIAERLCRMLTVHMQIEEELLYPQAHEAFGTDSEMIAVAQVEHGVMKDLVSQIEDLDEVDELFEAKMQVLTDMMTEHFHEEESSIFPKLERTGIDLDAMGEQIATRKRELAGDEDLLVEYEYDEEEQEPMMSRGRRGGRSTIIHSGRR